MNCECGSLLNSFLAETEKHDDLYDIRSFYNFLSKNDGILDPIRDVHHSVILKIIGKNNYIKIIRRINFYNGVSDRKIPKDDCFHWFYRSLIKKPHPLYYSYYTGEKNDKNTVLAEVKNLYVTNLRDSIKSYTSPLNTASSSRKSQKSKSSIKLHKSPST